MINVISLNKTNLFGLAYESKISVIVYIKKINQVKKD